MRFLIFLLLFTLTAEAYCQTQLFPSIGKEDIRDRKITGKRTFSGESLYGYINGGADLYLEYGFDGLEVTEFSIKKNRYKAEVWKMNDPLAAYGVFSVSRFKCGSRPEFSAFSCLNRYQLQVVCGPYYLNITNQSGNAGDSLVMISTALELVSQVKEASAGIEIFGLEDDPETLRNNSFVIRGRLGAVNCRPELEKYFRISGAYTALISEKNETVFISLIFNSSGAFQSFMSSNGWESDMQECSTVEISDREAIRRTGDLTLLIEIRNLL
jgi:hypothetical protein